jgi:hypothetical protein
MVVGALSLYPDDAQQSFSNPHPVPYLDRTHTLRTPRQNGQSAQETILKPSENLTMSVIPKLLDGVRDLAAAYSADQLDFMAVLGESPPLVQWLLAHADQQE